MPDPKPETLNPKPETLAAGCVAVVVVYGPPSVALTVFMLWYSDAYTAVLHAALDREKCLDVKILNGAARGFQAHHDYPLAGAYTRSLQSSA